MQLTDIYIWCADNMKWNPDWCEFVYFEFFAVFYSFRVCENSFIEMWCTRKLNEWAKGRKNHINQWKIISKIGLIILTKAFSCIVWPSANKNAKFHSIECTVHRQKKCFAIKSKYLIFYFVKNIFHTNQERILIVTNARQADRYERKNIVFE